MMTSSLRGRLRRRPRPRPVPRPVAARTAEEILRVRPAADRAAVVEALGEDPRRARRLLPRLLARERDVVVLVALLELADGLRQRVLAPRLRRLAATHASAFVRSYALTALVSAEGARARAFLRRRAREERSPYARVAALEGLVQLGEPAALSALVALFSSRRPLVRARLVHGLAWMQDAGVVRVDERLVRAWRRREEDPGVRRALRRLQPERR